MAFGNRPRRGRQPRRGRTIPSKDNKPFFIDNSVYPTPAEVAKLMKIPAERVRELEARVDEMLKSRR